VSVVISDTAVSSGGTNVLALLDQRAPPSFYWSDSAIATACIAEYAPRGRRGALSILQQWMITVGILAAFLVALVILWALRTRMPESPKWLLRHGRFEDTRRALAKLGIQVPIADIVFTASQLSETKNRSVEEITQLFERQAAGDRKAGMNTPRGADAAAA
jgi:hypothetical protein